MAQTSLYAERAAVGRDPPSQPVHVIGRRPAGGCMNPVEARRHAVTPGYRRPRAEILGRLRLLGFREFSLGGG